MVERKDSSESKTSLGKFCEACQAIPAAGHCGLAGCPMVLPSRTLSDTHQMFAQRLAIAREGLEMSQQELSRRAGLPASSISHFESGRRAPSIDNLVRLIRAMPGLNANWLLGLVPDKASVEYEDGYFDGISDAEEALAEVSRAASKRFSDGGEATTKADSGMNNNVS